MVCENLSLIKKVLGIGANHIDTNKWYNFPGGRRYYEGDITMFYEMCDDLVFEIFYYIPYNYLPPLLKANEKFIIKHMKLRKVEILNYKSYKEGCTENIIICEYGNVIYQEQYKYNPFLNYHLTSTQKPTDLKFINKSALGLTTKNTTTVSTQRHIVSIIDKYGVSGNNVNIIKRHDVRDELHTSVLKIHSVYNCNDILSYNYNCSSNYLKLKLFPRDSNSQSLEHNTKVYDCNYNIYDLIGKPGLIFVEYEFCNLFGDQTLCGLTYSYNNNCKVTRYNVDKNVYCYKTINRVMFVENTYRRFGDQTLKMCEVSLLYGNLHGEQKLYDCYGRQIESKTYYFEGEDNTNNNVGRHYHGFYDNDDIFYLKSETIYDEYKNKTTYQYRNSDYKPDRSKLDSVYFHSPSNNSTYTTKYTDKYIHTNWCRNLDTYEYLSTSMTLVLMHTLKNVNLFYQIYDLPRGKNHTLTIKRICGDNDIVKYYIDNELVYDSQIQKTTQIYYYSCETCLNYENIDAYLSYVDECDEDNNSKERENRLIDDYYNDEDIPLSDDYDIITDYYDDTNYCPLTDPLDEL